MKAFASARPLTFGIYPGGAAGTVGPARAPKPEDPAKRLQALLALRPAGAPFVVHLYAGYTGPDGWTAEQQVGSEIAQYTAAGLQVELVLTYRPAGGGTAPAVPGFVAFTQAAVQSFGSNPNFVSLQVTNEANVMGAPNAADGYYAGARDALIAGVLAAKHAIESDGFGQIKVGFNWANSDAPSERAFWSYLGAHGGPAFVRALDWVGLDAYPGTWGPPVSGAPATATAAAMRAALGSLRSIYMPLAGIPQHVALHVSENGYPTGPGRSDATQVDVLKAAVTTVAALSSQYNITDYRWFDLRDADSAGSDFEGQYGLMTDAYAPKPGFAAYSRLVAELSQPSASRTALLRRVQQSLHIG